MSKPPLRIALGEPIDPATAPALCPPCFVGQHALCFGPCDCRDCKATLLRAYGAFPLSYGATVSCSNCGERYGPGGPDTLADAARWARQHVCEAGDD